MTAPALLAGLLLALVVLASLWLVLSPLRAATPDDPDAAERGRLEAERDRLYAELRAGDEQARERPDLERRAALTLRALDALAPAPRAGAGRSRALALGGVALAAVVTVAGALTFVPRWQLAGLNAGEAKTVQAVLGLPGLRARAQNGGDEAAYLAWGDAAFGAGRYDQAINAYGGALQRDPRQPQALRRLGILLLTRPERGGQALSREDSDRAALLIRTAVQLAPDDAESQLFLGFALVRYGQDAEALTALERYRTLDPQGRDADDTITAIRARQNETDPALSVYAASCASCHGASGGGGVGPSLRASTLSRAAIQGIIRNGQGAMPAFPSITGTKLTALTDLLEKWQGEGQ
ncbi:c-type cytochrome [Deinococcus gobiensis]|uniref:c-type cytochrome n=1 Tax=Deinococcus gobiensis TaxID=502394 RepID=UPI0002EB651C|nr:c-type cytochrome [Deinococcus gobiensis]